MLSPDPYIRPSALSKLAACPGAAQLEAIVVDRFGEPAAAPEADVGTDMHNRIANAIDLWALQDREWGAIIAEACNEAAVDGLGKWDVMCLQRCLEFARDLIAQHQVKPANVLVEQKMDMTAFGFAQGGTADLVLIVPFERIVVVDWKCGFLDQGDAADHDQLQAYACAAAATFETDDVIVYVYQPRADRDRRSTAARFDAPTLLANATWTRAITSRARQHNPELRASYAGCLHCKALAHCAEARRWTMELLEAVSLIGDPTDGAAWGELISAAKIEEKRVEQVLDAAKAHLQAGGEAVGWGLQAGRAMTRIDAAKAIELAKAGGFLEDLLRFATIKAEAAKALPGLEEASHCATASPSLKPVKAKAVAA